MKRTLILIIAMVLTGWELYAGLWYISDANGRIGKPVSRVERAAHTQWLLSLEKKDNQEIRSLYFNHKLDNVVVMEREDGRLIRWVKKNSESQVLIEVEYVYDIHGNVLFTYINEPDDNSSELFVQGQSVMSFDTADMRYVSGTSDNLTIRDFNIQGQATQKIIIREGQLAGKETLLRDDEGKILQSVFRNGPATTIMKYDDNGQISEQRELLDGVVFTIENFTWEQDKLVRLEKWGGGENTVEESTWVGDEIIRKTWYVNGLKQQDVFFDVPGKKIETYYLDGEPLVRVYLVNGRRQREEFLEGDQVVRVRELGD